MLLDVQEITAFYGSSQALFGVNLSLSEGEVVALMGRNGMGKSTTIKAICNLVPPREGNIAFGGVTTRAMPTHKVARLGIGLVPEGRRCFPNLTVYENLVTAARPGPWTLARVYEAFPRLAQRKSNKGSQLSGGEQEMLAIARALLLNPKLMMLDEPSQGLAPLIVADVFRIIVAARKEGLSILLVEQNVRAAVEIADRAYVLDDGRIVYQGAAREFAADEDRVRELAGASAETWDMGD